MIENVDFCQRKTISKKNLMMKGQYLNERSRY